MSQTKGSWRESGSISLAPRAARASRVSLVFASEGRSSTGTARFSMGKRSAPLGRPASSPRWSRTKASSLAGSPRCDALMAADASAYFFWLDRTAESNVERLSFRRGRVCPGRRLERRGRLIEPTRTAKQVGLEQTGEAQEPWLGHRLLEELKRVGFLRPAEGGPGRLQVRAIGQRSGQPEADVVAEHVLDTLQGNRPQPRDRIVEGGLRLLGRPSIARIQVAELPPALPLGPAKDGRLKLKLASSGMTLVFWPRKASRRSIAWDHRACF